ncbi:MAG: tRNA 2-thiouridine(34) synthase MnmA, partial [Verrucomicrobiota bacterium]|nr:tRNA 2-thiouridine(34) synthase MnmA [Verrucomicrobiota bacterium]
IGQRKGLPGGSAQPRYVVDIDPANNRVIVGSAEDLISEEFELDRVNWVSRGMAAEPIEVNVKIRYSHPGTRATLFPQADGRARVELHEPQKAVTPGQAAVFYDGDLLLGGGWICRQVALAPA